MRRKWLWWLTGLAIFYTYLWIFLNYGKTQRDFPVYWAGAKAFIAGLNPYILDNLSAMLGRTLDLPFTYTPVALYIFFPLAALSYPQAFAAYFAVKWIFAIALFYVWLKYWVLDDRIYFVLFALAAYNRAIWGDLVAGNVVLIEQVLIWTAFTVLHRNRFALYGVAIVGAALFKMVPAAWAGPLFLMRSRKAALSGSLIIVATVALHGFSFTWSGLTVQQWLGSILWNHGGGRGNPCVHAFFKDLHQMYGLPFPKELYQGVAVLVVAVSLWCWLRRFEKRNPDHLKMLLLFSCLSLSFILGEFKGYSYILLIVPTWVAWTKILGRSPLGITIAFLVLETSIKMDAFPPFGLLWNYSPMFIAMAMWAVYLRSFFTSKLIWYNQIKSCHRGEKS